MQILKLTDTMDIFSSQLELLHEQKAAVSWKIPLLLFVLKLMTLSNLLQLESSLVYHYSMPAVGLEPTRRCRQQILSLPRLPFRHAGLLNYHTSLCMNVRSTFNQLLLSTEFMIPYEKEKSKRIFQKFHAI
jgi:hypothetical protein